MFLVIALAWGVAQVFLVPPLQVPDEGDHWFRAWALTDGQLMADGDAMVSLPPSFARLADLYTGLISDTQPLPPSLDGQPSFTGYENLFNGPATGEPIRVVTRVASYGPVGYVPQAAGIVIGRLMGVEPLTAFYLGRLTNLMCSIALVFFAIRLAPFGKPLFLLVGLLPMTMFELASLSCDALTISGAMFFTALLLWASTQEKVQGFVVAGILVAAALLLNVKPGYWSLALLVFLLRPEQLGGRGQYLALVAATGLIVASGFLAVLLATGTPARVQTDGGAVQQIQFILLQPLEFFGIVLQSLRDNSLSWTLQSIGVLGWFSVALPAATYLLVIVAFGGFLFRIREEVSLRRSQRALLLLVGVGTFLSMAAALYAFLEPVGSAEVHFQGRYLAPVWLLLLLSVYGIRFARRQLGVPLVATVLVVVMALSLQAIVAQYYP